jgi:hypothetical protein
LIGFGLALLTLAWLHGHDSHVKQFVSEDSFVCVEGIDVFGYLPWSFVNLIQVFQARLRGSEEQRAKQDVGVGRIAGVGIDGDRRGFGNVTWTLSLNQCLVVACWVDLPFPRVILVPEVVKPTDGKLGGLFKIDWTWSARIYHKQI